MADRILACRCGFMAEQIETFILHLKESRHCIASTFNFDDAQALDGLRMTLEMLRSTDDLSTLTNLESTKH